MPVLLINAVGESESFPGQLQQSNTSNKKHGQREWSCHQMQHQMRHGNKGSSSCSAMTHANSDSMMMLFITKAQTTLLSARTLEAAVVGGTWQ
jgi:hypothetical protein